MPTEHRILLCSPTPLTARLGASKVYIETAEALRRVGWGATLVGPAEVTGDPAAWDTPPARLREYLARRADEFDVIEFEHNRLPYPRAELPPGPLLVARSVLLTHTTAAAGIPPRPALAARVGWLLKWPVEARRRREALARADATLRGADLINVGNDDERTAVVAAGHPPGKVLVLPFGLFPERLTAFQPMPDELPAEPVIATVGTFDPRKGMGEWLALATTVLAAHPAARFRLIGTAGMVPTAEGVLSHFPDRLRPRVEVVPTFDPADLPRLLADCSLGVFPSYCEGFPFGVLEMLAAGLPVVAYRAPGPPMMLGPEFLVPKGDGRALGRRVSELLGAPDRLRAARRGARLRAEGFRWEEIAARTAAAYLAALERRAPAGAAR